MDSYAVVQEFYRETILPELIEYLGYEKALEFIEIFGGKRIYIPSVSDLKQIFRDAEIYGRLKDVSGSEFSEIQYRLSQRYHLTLEEVREIFIEMKQRVEGALVEELDEKVGMKKILDETLLQIHQSMIFDSKKNVRFRRSHT